MQIAKTLTTLFATASMAAMPIVAQAQDRQPAPVEESEELGGENSVALLALLAIAVIGAVVLLIREGNEDDFENMPSTPASP